MNIESRRGQIAEFWSWFAEHERCFHAVSGPTDAIFTDLLQKLQQIDGGLYFEVCSNSEPRELVLTAEGHKELFSLVDAVVAAAPCVPGWAFIPLKPPSGFDFQTTYEGINFNPKSMWFLPLQSALRPADLALRIGIPDYDTARKREAHNAVLVILDTAIGERSAALDIQHVEIAALPADPENQGYIELTDLPSYIQWRNRKRSAAD